ncbi:MAG: FlgD immunoglobulin-like domain containing protein [Ignavibacteriaceae bacterium]|jgi:hypothetical protein
MKFAIFSYLILCCCLTLLYPQEGGGNPEGWLPYEIFMLTKGLPTGISVQYKLETPGSVWDTNDIWPPQGYFLTNQYDQAFFPLTGTIGNLPIDWDQSDVHGFDFVNTGEDNDYYAYGFYKMTVTYSNSYFYLDYRDTRYRYYGSTINQNKHHPQDIWIMYDGSTDTFYYHSRGTLDLDPTTGGWTQINNGDYLSIWEIKEQSAFGSPQTSQFEYFWENALVLADDGNNHPLLVWGTYTSQLGVDHYNIYKKIGGGQFALHTEVQALNYIDENEVIIYGIPQANETEAFYKVAAVYPEGGEELATSDYTNTVSTRVRGGDLEKQTHLNHVVEFKTFHLFQNYPNPFNPSTIIAYQLASESEVSLTVYNLAGQEIRTLVNERQSAGPQQVVWDGKDLHGNQVASGIYLYRLKTENNIQTRKMILMK